MQAGLSRKCSDHHIEVSESDGKIEESIIGKLRCPRERCLMEVIRESGTDVPSMCYLKDAEHFTSCMVCVVKDRTQREDPSFLFNEGRGGDGYHLHG